jgi:hypothetical protein
MNANRSQYPICRHTKTNGLRCQSPALASSAFCYHHQKLRRTRMKAISSGPGLSTQVMHPLHNARSIQQALSMVLNGLVTGQIHRKQGGRMLYVLQTAMANLHNRQ